MSTVAVRNRVTVRSSGSASGEIVCARCVSSVRAWCVRGALRSSLALSAATASAIIAANCGGRPGKRGELGRAPTRVSGSSWPSGSCSMEHSPATVMPAISRRNGKRRAVMASGSARESGRALAPPRRAFRRSRNHHGRGMRAQASRVLHPMPGGAAPARADTVDCNTRRAGRDCVLRQSAVHMHDRARHSQ